MTGHLKSHRDVENGDGYTLSTSEPVECLPVKGIVEIILWVLQIGLSIGVIGLVLIHSGRGGGLSDMFGGGLGASAAGSTVMEKNLDRMTVIASLILAFNTLIMALVLDI